MSEIDRRRVDSADWLNTLVGRGQNPRQVTARSFEGAVVELGLISRAESNDLIRRARREGVSLLTHLLAEGVVTEDQLYETLATFNNLPYLPDLVGDLTPVVAPEDVNRCLTGRWIELATSDGRQIVVAAPVDSATTTMRHIPGGHGHTDPFDAISTPSAIRRWIETHYGDGMIDDAVLSLAETRPELSAQRRLSGGQRALIPAALLAFAAALFAVPAQSLTVLFALVSVVFIAGSLRLLMAFVNELGRKRPPPRPLISADQKLPLYTILVPLFRDGHMVEGIVDKLLNLTYPRSRLDIKLILEADDEKTRAAVAALALPGCFETLLTPPTWPRTKPKALAYGLMFARGSLVTVYDAGDEPHPDQLQRAVAAFAGGGRRLACVQSRLMVDNTEDGWLAKQSAIENAYLYNVLLPASARIGMPMMAGGTSSHYRTSAVRQAGGWDPYNLSGDVDIGIRLARFGCRCGWFDSDTNEQGPARLGNWYGQRLRRLRGSLQTYLVHMRQPLRAARELGVRRFIALQAALGVGFFASLAHPVLVVLLIVSAALRLTTEPQTSLLLDPLFVACAVNLLVGYGVMIELGVLGLYRAKRPDLLWQVALMPVYWMLASIAAYGAIWRLIVRPFEWEKTKHTLRRKPALNPLHPLSPSGPSGSPPDTSGWDTHREAVQRVDDTDRREQRSHEGDSA